MMDTMQHPKNGNTSSQRTWASRTTSSTQLLSRAERAPAVLTDAELLCAATTQEEGEKWVQLCNDLKHILINITSSAAATVCRQYHDAMGLEVCRQLCNRFATPVGTRSIGYLTKLLKPTFDINNFEKSFPTWEFELARYERDNNAQLPDRKGTRLYTRIPAQLCTRKPAQLCTRIRLSMRMRLRMRLRTGMRLRRRRKRRSGRRSGRMRGEGEGEDEEQQFQEVYILAYGDD